MFKKKRTLIVLFTIVLILFTGCSKKSNGNSDSSKNRVSTSKKVKAEFYQNLSKADKSKVKFKFKNDMDLSNSEGTPDGLPGAYSVSMTVENKTKKTIKFDKSKFIIYLSNQHMNTSKATGTLTLKPGEHKYIDQIFESVQAQMFVSKDAYFIYLNTDNKLGKPMDLTPQAPDTPSDKGSSVSNTQNNDSSDDADENEAPANSGRANAGSTQQAINIISSQFGVPASDLTASLSDSGGYVISSKTRDESWRMGMSGIVIEHIVNGEPDPDYE